MKLAAFVLTLCAALLTGCDTKGKTYKQPLHGVAATTIHVVRHGWHTGIVIRVADIPKDMLPEKKDFPAADYLEIGWGDAGFYRAEDITLALALDALLHPTESIVHIVGFKGPVAAYFRHSAVFRLQIGHAAVKKLAGFLHGSVLRNGKGAAQNTGPGRYGISKFYKGTGTYHMFRTCNNWTAEAMVETGIPISVFASATAEGMMDQLREHALVLREMPGEIAAETPDPAPDD